MAVVNKPPVLISSASLDATFSGDGLTSIAIGVGSDQARGIAIQSDGRYVVAGWSDAGGGNYDFAVVRFNTDGSLDSSFSGDGKQTTSIGAGADKAYGVAIQSDGRIVVAGSTHNGSNDDFAIVRYNTNGSLDTGFSGDGIQTTSFSASDDDVTALAIQADGKILAVGTSNTSFAVARYDSTGLLDSTFDTDGRHTGKFDSSNSVANAIALQSDGKIIVAGYGYSGTSWDFGVARLTAAGVLDGTFSGDGKALFHLNSTSSSPEEFTAIAIQFDGKLLLAGRTVGAAAGDTFDAVLMRLDASGNPDASFGGGDGIVTLNRSSWDEFDSVVVQADGKILAGGSVKTGLGEALIARFNADGTLDTSFSGDGVFSTRFSSGTSTIYGFAVAPSGQVAAAGDSFTGTYDFGMLRLSSELTDQSAIARSAFSYTVPAGAFFDADGNPLSYAASLASGAALPAWLSFDATTRRFSGIPADADFGARQVKVSASDGSASVSATFQLEVSTDFIEALRYTDHARWNEASPNGTPGTALSFSFMDAAPTYASANETSTFAPMSAAQKQAVRDVLQLYREIAGVSFTEVADAGAGGQLRFGTYLQTGTSTAAYAAAPSSSERGGDVWVNRSSTGYDTPVAGDYSFETLVHEIGHALGLKHPGAFKSDDQPPFLAAGVDNTQYTLMSYNSRTDALFRDVTGATAGDIHFINVSARTPMLYDVAAIQFIYGANTATRSGNDSYTFDPSTPFFRTLWDGGGTDTISVSNFTEACIIDLRDGRYSSIRIVSDPLPPDFTGTEPTYFGADNLAIAFGSIIENAAGGGGNDALTGNDAGNRLDGGGGNDSLYGGAGNDTITGGAGNDTIDGGSGTDIEVYSGNRAEHSITRNTDGSYTVRDQPAFILPGGDGSDSLTNVERLQFSDMGLALDLAGNAGTVAKILGAVFGAGALANGQWVGIGLSYVDAGMSYADLMQLALSARLGAGYSDEAEIRLLYQNLLGISPTQTDIATWSGAIAAKQFTQASLAVMAADTTLNAANIQLTGLAATGLDYFAAG